MTGASRSRRFSPSLDTLPVKLALSGDVTAVVADVATVTADPGVVSTPMDIAVVDWGSDPSDCVSTPMDVVVVSWCDSTGDSYASAASMGDTLVGP